MFQTSCLFVAEQVTKLEIICSNSKSVNAEISHTSTGPTTCGNTALSPKAKSLTVSCIKWFTSNYKIAVLDIKSYMMSTSCLDSAQFIFDFLKTIISTFINCFNNSLASFSPSVPDLIIIPRDQQSDSDRLCHNWRMTIKHGRQSSVIQFHQVIKIIRAVLTKGRTTQVPSERFNVNSLGFLVLYFLSNQ